jgi:hypothetical protein
MEDNNTVTRDDAQKQLQDHKGIYNIGTIKIIQPISIGQPHAIMYHLHRYVI